MVQFIVKVFPKEDPGVFVGISVGLLKKLEELLNNIPFTCSLAVSLSLLNRRNTGGAWWVLGNKHLPTAETWVQLRVVLLLFCM